MQSDQFGKSSDQRKMFRSQTLGLGEYRKSVSEVHNEKTDELCDI